MVRKLVKLITVICKDKQTTYQGCRVSHAIAAFIEDNDLDSHGKYYELEYQVTETWVYEQE